MNDPAICHLPYNFLSSISNPRRICPALLQQSLTTACDAKKPPSPAKTPPSLTEIYGYGFLATAVITLLSLVGVIMVPCLSKSFYEQLMSAFICLGIGTMLGDSFLHLIPLALELHGHGSAEKVVGRVIYGRKAYAHHHDWFID